MSFIGSLFGTGYTGKVLLLY